METQLSRQCSDARHARSLDRMLRRMAALFGAVGLRFGSDGLHATRPIQVGADEHDDGFPSNGPRAHGAPQESCSSGRDSITPTPGELEALRWAMDGMTDAEIGLKVGLSEREVASRLRRVMHKLGCRTKYEAVLKAIKMRWIEGL